MQIKIPPHLHTERGAYLKRTSLFREVEMLHACYINPCKWFGCSEVAINLLTFSESLKMDGNDQKTLSLYLHISSSLDSGNQTHPPGTFAEINWSRPNSLKENRFHIWCDAFPLVECVRLCICTYTGLQNRRPLVDWLAVCDQEWL